ncbi:hypothetical protein BG000_009557 [Podila horticola]|nr:hypothetical protein BG000_009557 [Podila horticola]
MSSQKQDTHVMLIESVRHLRSFVLYAESMTPRICQALLDLHCDWLEKLDLTIHQPGAEDFSTANMILASCPNLVSFAMSAVYYFESWRPVDCLTMFSRLWICTKLMKVQVCGFAPTTVLVDRRVNGGESAASSTESGPNVGEDHLISTYGWVAHVPDNREAHITAKDQTMLLGAFLEQTGTCPDLCEITLNTAVYIRTTR